MGLPIYVVYTFEYYKFIFNAKFFSQSKNYYIFIYINIIMIICVTLLVIVALKVVSKSILYWYFVY